MFNKLVGNTTNCEQWMKIFKIRYEYFYDGILTVDTVGCNTQCAFCFTEKMRRVASSKTLKEFFNDCENKNKDAIEKKTTWKYEEQGKELEIDPQDLAVELLTFSNRYGYNKIRFSSGEPTLNYTQFLSFCKIFHEKRSKQTFMLETNGINIGKDFGISEQLVKYRDWLHIRLSLKTLDEEKYIAICGNAQQFKHSRKAYQFLIEHYPQNHHLAFIEDILTPDNYEHIRKLRLQDPNLIIETEPIYYYPHVKETIREKGLESLFLI